MVDSPRSSRALGALLGLATAGALVLGPAPGALAAPTGPSSHLRTIEPAADVTRATPAQRAAAGTPLRVTIDELSPAYLPRSGQIRVTGSVTNRDDEAWTTIKLYPLLGDDLPAMQDPGTVAASLDVPADAYVGERVTESDTAGLVAGSVDELGPGESARYSITVPVSAFDVTAGGVYWFGVHALGQSGTAPRDTFTDGRARTLMPAIPDRISAQLPVSVVIPLTRPIPYAADGSLDDLARWQRSLSAGGRLHDLVDFAAAAPSDLTWVVDPALIDAVARLARGNPPRSLRPTVTTEPPAADPDSGGQPTETAESLEGAEATSGGTDDSTDDSTDGGVEGSDAATDTQTAQTAALAQEWLRATRSVLEAGQVLTLPYGNLDVPAALDHDASLLDLARAKTSQVLQGWDLTTTPVTTGPDGYLDTASMAATDDGVVLMSDAALGGIRSPVASVDGRRVVAAASGIADGGPGPGPALTSVGLRQRILAEAAVRVIKADKEPLVAVLPTNWTLEDGADFLGGLDAPWVDLEPLSGLDSEAAVAVDPDAVVYPDSQRERELPATLVEDVQELIDSGDSLQNLLTDNTGVAGLVAGEALTRASYAARGDQFGTQQALAASLGWVRGRLGEVSVTAPRGVTLASGSGGFSATVTNDLDEPVTVRLGTRSDEGIEVSTQMETVQIAARSRSTVPLDVEASTTAVHRVTLFVTDAEGNPIGSTDDVPIRASQVSGVIWAIMGTGVGILFLAIGLRLLRRVRAARAASTEPAEPADPTAPTDAATAGPAASSVPSPGHLT